MTLPIETIPSNQFFQRIPSDEEAQVFSSECTAKKLANKIGKTIFISFVGAFNCTLFFASITALTLAVQKEDDMSAVKTMAISGAALGAFVAPLLYVTYGNWKKIGAF